jgi:hypothetical protein
VRYETVMSRQHRTRALTGAAAACLLVLAGLSASAPAGAVTFQQVFAERFGARDLRVTLGFDDPALQSLLESGEPDVVQTRELLIPLITPSLWTGTPAAPGSDLTCLSLLAAEGMIAAEAEPAEGIATPVLIPDAGIGGVRYRQFYPRRPARIIDCRLALALLRAAPVLRANGVAEVVFLSHYRPSYGLLKPGQYNFHSQGLAIDIWGFRTSSGLELSIRRDYETGLGFADPQSCLGRPMTLKGMLLRKIACDLDLSDAFEAILTPDFDAQHWNHYHLSAFHVEQRSLVRPRGTALLEVPVSDLTAWALRRANRQQPERRRWDEVAARPWPERYRWVRDKLGLPAPPSDAELAALVLQDVSPVGQVWASLMGLVDRLTLEIEGPTRELLDPALEELSQLLDPGAGPP